MHVKSSFSCLVSVKLNFGLDWVTLPPALENHKKSVPVLAVETLSNVGRDFCNESCLIHKPQISGVDRGIFSSKFFNSSKMAFPSLNFEKKFLGGACLDPPFPPSYYGTLLQLNHVLRAMFALG